MKILSLFSGIGAFEKALDNMGVNYDLVGFSEIDKYAVKSYCAIHGVSESKNLGDITKIDTSKLPKNIDLITYGFPCQDISLAGAQRGFEHDGERTRSGLFFEALRIIEDCQPKFAICENVKNLTSKKFSKEFDIVLSSLDEAGYKNYWKVLNAKDYGIPQNRERVFIISIRKDLDKGYEFPEPYELKLRLKDMLENTVDEKYYLKKTLNITTKENYIQWDNSGKGYKSQQDRAYYQDGLSPTLSHCNNNGDKSQVVLCDKPILVGGIGERNFGSQYRQGNRIYDSNAVAMCLTAQPVGNAGGNSYLYSVDDTEKVINVCNVNPSGRGQNGSVIDSEGLARTITQEKGEGQKILVREATKKGYAEAYDGDSINMEQPNSKTRRGRVGKQVAQTLTTSPQQGVVING